MTKQGLIEYLRECVNTMDELSDSRNAINANQKNLEALKATPKVTYNALDEDLKAENIILTLTWMTVTFVCFTEPLMLILSFFFQPADWLFLSRDGFSQMIIPFGRTYCLV